MLSLNFSLDQNDYYAFNLAFQRERLKESPGKKMLGLILPIGLLVMLLVLYWPILQNDGISVLTTSIPFIILVVYTLIRLIYFGKNSRVNPIVTLLIKQQNQHKKHTNYEHSTTPHNKPPIINIPTIP